MTAPYRVALNCAILQRGISGTAAGTRYIAQALRGTPRIDLIELAPTFELSDRRAVNAGRSAYWDLWAAGRRAGKVDALVSPCNIGMAPRHVPHVLVMQDTMVLDHPELFDPGYAGYARLLFGRSVRAATRVVTVSDHAAASIRRHWDDASPLTVIGWPAPPLAQPRVLGQTPLTVVMVGRTEPHKNHVGGIEAVRLARLMTQAPLQLEVIGPAGHAEEAVSDVLHIVDPTGAWARRRYTLSEPELDEAYRRAWALLQPSLTEGFGLPLLEAAAGGLPVVHSGAASMSEVCPEGSARGGEPEMLAERLRTLLDPLEYEAASRSSLDAARARSWDAFEEAWRGVICEVTA